MERRGCRPWLVKTQGALCPKMQGSGPFLCISYTRLCVLCHSCLCTWEHQGESPCWTPAAQAKTPCALPVPSLWLTGSQEENMRGMTSTTSVPWSVPSSGPWPGPQLGSWPRPWRQYKPHAHGALQGPQCMGPRPWLSQALLLGRLSWLFSLLPFRMCHGHYKFKFMYFLCVLKLCSWLDLF